MTNETIYIDDLTITVYRKKVKNINLRISRDGCISVSTSNKISIKKLEQYLRLKKDWIINSLNKMDIQSREKIKPLEYVNGEEIQLQGVKYKLLNIEDNENKVETEENVIYLYSKDISNYKKKKILLDKYISTKATELFEKSLEEMLELVKPYRVNKPEMRIRKMKSRWGSCNKVKKKITINYELVKVKKECLDYVVLHELLHFLESGHNKRFYNFMTTLMPDWKTRKKILNKHQITY